MCRDDLVQVGKGSSNSTLIVRTVNVGLTLLAVWDSGQTGLTDYLALPVQHVIHPAEAQRLVVGDVVCFSALLVNQEGKIHRCDVFLSLTEGPVCFCMGLSYRFSHMQVCRVFGVRRPVLCWRLNPGLGPL